ncbi:MAG TPA: class I SAM-dependent methyltransferase [Desulfuromonadales bacterium]|nr:class I SAM-dependent methyltransferase [Desulfuromonadales bacterium]
MFKDHFSQQAADYNRYRPGYPEELFAWLARQTGRNETAWDCGCGNGQASLGLVPFYRQVIATDSSPRQIENAFRHERVSYVVASAEESGLSDGSVDLIVVAQALHWFDFDRFYREVRRVAAQGAVLAAVSYGEVRVEGGAAAVLSHFYHDIIAPYWPPERRHVDEGYAGIPFPFSCIESPRFVMEVDWNQEQLLGYLSTWSAVGEFKKQNGRDPRELIDDDLRNTWGKAEQVRRVSWPLTLQVGRVGK